MLPLALNSAFVLTLCTAVQPDEVSCRVLYRSRAMASPLQCYPLPEDCLQGGGGMASQSGEHPPGGFCLGKETIPWCGESGALPLVWSFLNSFHALPSLPIYMGGPLTLVPCLEHIEVGEFLRLGAECCRTAATHFK